MTIIRTITAAAVLAAGLAVSAPASADITTFASYIGVGGQNIYYRKVSSLNSSLYTIAAPGANSPGTVSTVFTFLSPSVTNRLQQLANLGALRADFTFRATATAPVDGARNLSQDLLSGSFSFIYKGAAPLVVDHTTYYTNANLLSATFGGGSLAGRLGSNAANVDGSTAAGDTIGYTSDLLNFAPTNEKDFALSLNALSPALGRTVGQVFNTFFATSSGNFSTDPAPLPTAIIPEPATWGLLVVGFGLVGLQGRRRSRSSSVAA